MVKIAVPGGAGQIASELIDVLSATKKHEILIISRKAPPTPETRFGVIWAQSDYTDKEQLTGLLKGVHTVLSFVLALQDVDNVVQKMLVEACISAGVKRFAPSEWSSSSIEQLPWYAAKGNMREYLADINKEKKVIEYTLFQVGLLIDYLAPLGTNKHLVPPSLWQDFLNRRGMVVGGKEGYGTFTTMNDIANVVARVVEYEGEWPVVSGIHGTDLSISQLIEIGIKARGGKPFDIDVLKEEDIIAGDLKTSWNPLFIDPNMPPEQIVAFSKIIVRGCLLSSLCKSWVVSDEWNKLLPDYKFDNVEEFLIRNWAGKP